MTHLFWSVAYCNNFIWYDDINIRSDISCVKFIIMELCVGQQLWHSNFAKVTPATSVLQSKCYMFGINTQICFIIIKSIWKFTKYIRLRRTELIRTFSYPSFFLFSLERFKTQSTFWRLVPAVLGLNFLCKYFMFCLCNMYFSKNPSLKFKLQSWVQFTLHIWHTLYSI